MPIEAKPLYRPDALGPMLCAFKIADEIAAKGDILDKWATLLSPDQPKSFREQELLPDFITDVFWNLLGYECPADKLSREQYSRPSPLVYGYAINLPCDWIIITSMHETRLYLNEADQITFEQFKIEVLAANEAVFRSLVYLFAVEGAKLNNCRASGCCLVNSCI